MATSSDQIHRFSDKQIDLAALDLRLALRKHGQTDALVARCCALVKEISNRTLGMQHYDAQLLGGWAMSRGKLVEMQTGEGKTLTATLPVCVAALAGVPVHVMTVNDYLAARDAQLMSPIYSALGLSVGVINASMQPDERRAAYACDITYCTAQQIAFDYLKDRTVMRRNPSALMHQVDRLNGGRQDRLLLRGLCFGLVDEADSILIDEATTPLVLSRPGDSTEYERGFSQSLSLAMQLQQGQDFSVNEHERSIQLTEAGRRRLADLAEPLGGIWTGVRKT